MTFQQSNAIWLRLRMWHTPSNGHGLTGNIWHSLDFCEHHFNGHATGTDWLKVPNLPYTYNKAYGRECPQQVWPYMVQHLHLILKFLLIIGLTQTGSKPSGDPCRNTRVDLLLKVSAQGPSSNLLIRMSPGTSEGNPRVPWEEKPYIMGPMCWAKVSFLELRQMLATRLLAKWDKYHLDIYKLALWKSLSRYVHIKTHMCIYIYIYIYI